MFKLKSLCILSLSLSFSLLSAQNLYEQSFRKWDEGPVKWNEFQVRHTPNDVKFVSNLFCVIDQEVKKRENRQFQVPSFNFDRQDEQTLIMV